MIKSIFEFHFQVSDLDASIKFYELLGLKLASKVDGNVAFMMVGEGGEKLNQELGLWVVEKDQEVMKRHLAFEVDFFDLLKAKKWLHEKKIETVGAFGHGNNEPIVHKDGLVSFYFNDPDGNELEFASRITEPQIKLDRTVPLSQWIKLALSCNN